MSFNFFFLAGFASVIMKNISHNCFVFQVFEWLSGTEAERFQVCSVRCGHTCVCACMMWKHLHPMCIVMWGHLHPVCMYCDVEASSPCMYACIVMWKHLHPVCMYVL